MNKAHPRISLLFPLALVLFEFAVYICNDMVQPAMLAVTREFAVDVSWAPLSMTAFLAGGALLPWLTGPLSDRIGRRPVLLFGVAWFTLACLATYLVDDIESFMALRVLQGVGLCFINAVGYAAVQEAFPENTAVRVTALMANVALIAPLAGPLAGATLIEFAPWRLGFAMIAGVSFIALIGLACFMPETVKPSHDKLPLSAFARDYRKVFSNRRFVLSALCIPLIAMPLMGWIALSPVLLVEDLGLTSFEYGVLQVPVFGGLILGNLVLAAVAERWPLGRSALLARGPVALGVAVLLGGVLLSDAPQYWMAGGMTLMAFAEGMAFGVLYRFALTSCDEGKGTVSAAMSMLCMGAYALGIETLRWAYRAGGLAGFGALALGYALAFALVASRMVPLAMAARAEPAPQPEAAEGELALCAEQG